MILPEVPMLKGTYNDAEVRGPWEAGDMACAASVAIARLGPEVLAFLVGTLRDANAADEAFSLFCERLWTSLPRFEWKCSLRTWVYVISRRAAADVLRVEWRQRKRHAQLSDSKVSAIAQRVRTATRSLLKTQRKTALSRLRDELSEKDKTLLVLRVDRGLQWEELACIFLSNEAPSEDEIRRESARLRKRFQLVKAKLRELARAAGLLSKEPLAGNKRKL